ncbi:MAG TPA: hypothetical protein VNE62_13265 [Actinomycetota bacterium]|nr:hypothetical protein [Actinomycetota bacterium]
MKATGAAKATSVAWLVTAALIATAVAGCARGEAPYATPAATASSRGSSPTPETGPAASPPEGRAPATGSTPRATARPSAAPAAQSPEAAVRGLLDAIDREDYATQRLYSSGPASALVFVRDVIDQENSRRGASTDNSVKVVEPPKVMSSDDRSARVSVKAGLTGAVSGPEGNLTSDDVLEGPVEVRRDGGSWKVTDFVYTGGRLSENHFEMGARQSKEGFTLTARAALSYKKTTVVLIAFSSDGGETAPLSVTGATLIDAAGKEHTRNQAAFESAAAPSGFFGFERVEGRPSALRVEVKRQDKPRTWTYDLRT